MVKYYICYEDLLESGVTSKVYDINSPELFIAKKNDNNEYSFNSLSNFKNISNNISNYIMPSNIRTKSILMVELSKEEVLKYNPLLIKKFELLDNGKFKKILEDSDKKEINLINYSCIASMSYRELEKCSVVTVTRCLDDPGYYFIGADRSKLLIRDDINNRRYSLKRSEIGCDLYFYTEDKDILEKYFDEITTFKRNEPDKYKIIYSKLFVIDSISQDKIFDFGKDTQKLFYELCNYDSIAVNIEEKEDKYDITRRSSNSRFKKAYIITNDNLKNIFFNSAILPLMRYINVFIYDGDFYKKVSLEEYINSNNLIKLNKKPSN